MAPEARSRLYIVAEAGMEPRQWPRCSTRAEVAALLVAPAADAPLDARTARPLVELAQAQGRRGAHRGRRSARAHAARRRRAPALEQGHRGRATAQAREILGGRFIVGADAGRSRDDAMTLGEAGADYVGFGIPAHVEDRETARERRLDLVAWWSEIFEVPCVAFDVERRAGGGRARAGRRRLRRAAPRRRLGAGRARALG